nr:U-box domain-containing protein 17-like [Tanacetum cinerariifolium]
MASAAIFSSLRRSRSPSLDAFLAPVDLDNNLVSLLQTLQTVAKDLISKYSNKPMSFQKRNTRSLLRKIELFVTLLDSVADSNNWSLNLPSAVVLCFKEMYLVLYRCKILLDYCNQSSKIWMLLQNPSISGHFHDLNQEIYTLLDVIPINELSFLSTTSDDVKEQIFLMQKQSRKGKLFIDGTDEVLRLKFFELLTEIGCGKIPSLDKFRAFFVEKLGFFDARACRVEIDFLEEQIVNHESDLEPSASVLGGFIAMI